MQGFPINYIGQVFRPPSEARSLLLQVTIGCSHNRCTYCMMYRDKKFQVRDIADLRTEIHAAKNFYEQLGHYPRKIFLCDGDALAAPFGLLMAVLQEIQLAFPMVERVGTYVTAQNVLDKTDWELQELARLKLTIGYLGLESGDNDVLHLIHKGNTQQDMLDALSKIHKAGWNSSVIAMLGVGGKKLSAQHIAGTAKVISLTAPTYFSFLTTMALPNSPYARMVEKGGINPLTTKELLWEMRSIIEQISSSTTIILRVNHVSNMFPLAGCLPLDKMKILEKLDKWIELEPDGVFPPLPSFY